MLRAKDNPFSTDRVLQQRYRLDGVGFTALQHRLRELGYRGALVGPHGSGKTTLWEDLADHFQDAGWRVHRLRLSEEHHQLGERFGERWSCGLGSNDFVFLDGAEQLSWWRWLRFRHALRNAGGLLITTHREGRLATLHRCATTPALLAEIADALGEHLDAKEASALHARFQGNIREALRELYDRAAAR